MDKNIIKETMLSLEGAALQSAREKYFDYVADARLDRSEPIERDEQAQAEIASDLSEALDDTLHDHTDKLDKLREAFSARVTNSPPPTFGGQGPLKRAGLAGLFEKQYYVQSAKAYKPAQIVYHMVAQNWTSRLPTAAWSPPTCGTRSEVRVAGMQSAPITRQSNAPAPDRRTAAAEHRRKGHHRLGGEGRCGLVARCPHSGLRLCDCRPALRCRLPVGTSTVAAIVVNCCKQASLEYGAREHKRYLAQPIPGDTIMQKDIETLTTLNHDFVKSVQGADVKRFDEILAKDFLFTNPDGSLYNRAEFLDLIGKGARISELREDQVNVRLFGDFAIIHARIQYRSKAGIERIGRYTDDWARRDGKWLCVSAHTSGEDL